MDPEGLGDEQLVAYIEWLSHHGEDREGLEGALDELFNRIRDDARPGERDDAEKAITQLRRIFTEDDDDGPDVLGVREPRRPSPHAGDAATAIDPSDGRGEAA
jgi:hypothetical protein